MILFEIVGTEAHPAYETLEVANGNRQYDFLLSMVVASLQLGRPFLSTQLLKALNFQAIACLHVCAGEYRPCDVRVVDGTGTTTYQPPDPYRVTALMDDFINTVNRTWETADPVALAAFVLWRLNHIHPFINGNGRTARAACYFVLCVQAKQWLPGKVILPELLRRDHSDYVAALRHADLTSDLSQLHALLMRLLSEQLATANGGGGAAPSGGATPPSDPMPPPGLPAP